MPHPSEIAQHGGTAIALTSAGVGWANQTMGWLNSNSPGILALCGIGGLLISYMGYRAKRKHEAILLANELRLKQRRKQ